MANYYNTVEQFLGAKPAHLNDSEGQRVAAYDFYDALVDNAPGETFRLLLRGNEANPIFIPTAKKVVKTLARYVAKDAGFSVEGGSDTENVTAITAYGDLFNRERFFSKFAGAKRRGLGRGDMCLYVYADINKPEGARLSIEILDPRTYFPIEDPLNPSKLLGADIIEVMVEGSNQYIRRQRYFKSTHPLHSAYVNPPAAPNYEAPIEYMIEILEMQNWETEPKRVSTPVPQAPLEAGITQLPIYHIRFYEEDDYNWGKSVLSGIERICLAVNQTITDEHVAVSMASLGMWKSSGPPASGAWVIGPKQVVEDEDFDRVNGIESLDVPHDHMDWLLDTVDEATGVNDVATGKVDTTIAESGIAIALRMGPLFDETKELDDVVMGVLKQFFYDLKSWFAAYESISFGELVEIMPVFGDKLPRNVQEELDQLQDLFANGVISMQTYHEKLKELGVDIPADEAARIERETKKNMELADPYGDRLGQEGEDTGEEPPASEEA